MGCHKEAIDSYDRALEFDPDRSEPWYARGIPLANLGLYEEAIDSFEKSMEANLASPAVYLKACCYAWWGKADEAIEQLQKAIALDPEYQQQAKTDSDLDSLREDQRFQDLVKSNIMGRKNVEC